MPQLKNNQLAISMMMLHALAVAGLFVLMKLLTKEISSNFAVFVYKFISLFFLLPWVLSKGGLSNLYTKKISIYIIGSILGTSATLCLMYGLKFIPVANVTILGYLEKVLLILIGIFYFKEKLSWTIILSIIICIAGAIIIVIPKFNHQIEFNHYYTYILLSIILWVLYCLTVKYLGDTDSFKCQTFYTVALSTILSFFVSYFLDKQDYFVKQAFTSNQLILFIFSAFLYIIISTSLFKSFRTGNLSIITPFGYTKVVFAAILGYIFFGEIPSLIQIIGYSMIIISSWYIAYQNSSK